ncbi:hypothetical protein SAMN04488136_11656 [Vibrio xiamenensis]|uniref:Uncharacterized protein n=1 Tax=Vibrio xiamenensis TaxID=861298 RepID=A0A1G8CGG2_9VIBR|nr:hypothetical protein SAMN04488136_11656 [Vibrio xiamenensis]
MKPMCTACELNRLTDLTAEYVHSVVIALDSKLSQTIYKARHETLSK